MKRLTRESVVTTGLGYRTRPNPLSEKTKTTLKIGAGVAALVATGMLIERALVLYQVRQEAKANANAVAAAAAVASSSAGMLSPGSQTLTLQAPKTATSITIASALLPVVGTVQPVSFTAIPLAAEDALAGTLWSVAVSFPQATSLAALNAALGAGGSASSGLAFLADPPPALSYVQNGFAQSTGKALTLTLVAASTGTAPAPGLGDVVAYLQGLGLTGVTAQPAPSPPSSWTASGTGSSTGALSDLTVTYRGGSQSFALATVA